MSYDISIGDQSFNYTFNVASLFYDHMPDTGKGGGVRELAGITGAEGVMVISAALKNMNATRRKLEEVKMREKYDAPNGWGSTLGGVLWLGEILAACIEFPNDFIDVSL